jgi:hypothetical protein
MLTARNSINPKLRFVFVDTADDIGSRHRLRLRDRRRWEYSHNQLFESILHHLHKHRFIRSRIHHILCFWIEDTDGKFDCEDECEYEYEWELNGYGELDAEWDEYGQCECYVGDGEECGGECEGWGWNVGCCGRCYGAFVEGWWGGVCILRGGDDWEGYCLAGGGRIA